MALTREQYSLGAGVAVLAAVIGVVSSMLTLYNQAGDVFNLVTAGNFAPVGTIVASTLNEQDFAKMVREDPGALTTTRKWVLADGRDAIGTKFASGRSVTLVPDLRGMFLRGIDPSGSADPDGTRLPGSIQHSSTALPTNSFSGVTSDDGGHALPDFPGLSANDRFNAGEKDYPVVGIGKSDPLPPHHHNLTISTGGDLETRPNNVAVFYYIKVN